ncbi:acyl-CoA dehydrogenase family protein [Arthrobacter sp. TMS2-4]
MERVDDWDGFGQRLTGSGTTHFTEVRVDPRNVRHYSGETPSHVPAFFQLVLVASLAGIARAAAEDAADFVRPRTRSYVNATTPLPREGPQVLQVVGELGSSAFAADAVVLAAADLLDAAYERLRSGVPAAGGPPDDGFPGRLATAAVDEADIAVSGAQVVAVAQSLRAATELFEVGGASATSTGRALDRHWRNARTISSHNPAIYKARSLGYWAVHGEREPRTAGT